MLQVRSLLAIRLARLGDVVLLLPALARLKLAFPDAKLTLMTGHRCAPLAELCPAVDEVMSVDRVAMRDGPAVDAIREMARLVSEVRNRRFDVLIDFHSFRETNLLAWLSKAPQRLGLKRRDGAYLPFCFNIPPVPEDKSVHISEMFEQVAEAVPGFYCTTEKPHPVLVVPEAVQTWLGEIRLPAPWIALYVGAAAPDRMWPTHRFARLADWVIERWGASVLVLAGGAQAGVAEEVRQAVKHRDRVLVLHGLTLPRLAGVVGASQLLASNDTGPMHIGPALGVPTLGLFSVGFPEHYRPLGTNCRYLRQNPIEGISLESVLSVFEDMRSTAVPDRPR